MRNAWVHSSWFTVTTGTAVAFVVMTIGGQAVNLFLGYAGASVVADVVRLIGARRGAR